ncbi:carboxylating nicotinate-nucleotide diphosphorylase [Clostridium grantii]|uniref:Probable nicotinate-nucleotide pyrophosphorylase [carboxylating] n=1 Tax=Clostridium grantii DSM 8605 TaxID=1121316 RepID=A0A1M5R145_9CLOT|nr:carboxylating nicotinate-nucleotide diphosphorylase [Clostridium grantii]SHH19689.1 nicotinate-nucleotide pyrophosphorylase [carboxylating] [Clostridium grantii DSM 8605]
MNWLVVDEILKKAIEEDAIYGDITSNSIVSVDSKSTVELIAKEDGIIAGLEVFERVFFILGSVEVEYFVVDGDFVNCGRKIANLKGSTRNILLGERVALNILQRMSGIATISRKMCEKISHTKAKILDTRKTTPNLRILEKYAAKVGGAENHRFNLSDGVMIKDNHINAAGSIEKAVAKVRENTSFVRKIEVEVENLEQLKEAMEAKVDIIMLDNMDIETMKTAVKMINKSALVEASGNVTLETVKAIAETGIEYISSGMLTHSVKALDISMKNLQII